MSLSRSVGARSFGIVVDFVGLIPHAHILLGHWALTLGKGWTYQNIHEADPVRENET